MPKIKIEGGHQLTGTIKVGGAKNSVVAFWINKKPQDSSTERK